MKRGPRTPKKPAPANQRRAPPSLRPSLAGPATPGPLDSRTDPRACPSAPAGPLPPPPRLPLLPMPPPPTPPEGGKPSVPSARGAPAKAQLRRRAPITLSQASSGSAKGARARAGGLLLPLRSAVWSISLPEALAQVKGAGGAGPAPAGNPLFSDSRGPICPGCPLCLPLRSTPWRAGPGLLGTPLRGRGGRRLPGKARRDRELEREAAGAGPLQPDRAGERPPYLPLRAPRNACCLARTRCLSEKSQSAGKSKCLLLPSDRQLDRHGGPSLQRTATPQLRQENTATHGCPRPNPRDLGVRSLTRQNGLSEVISLRILGCGTIPDYLDGPSGTTKVLGRGRQEGLEPEEAT
nr:uncharacterized protein LOC116158151 [Camelus dromedarius]